MKILYIAPRFHTNQAPIMKGWLERGDEVMFISYYKAPIEDYSYIQPVVIGFSAVYKFFDWLYVDIIKRNDLNALTFKIVHGFPPVFKLRKAIKNWKPDIVIMRDRTIYSIVSYLITKKMDCRCILYNQSPLWDKPLKQDFMHRLVRKLTPHYRMTSVMGVEEKGKEIASRSYFIPFAVEPQQSPNEKKYFKGDRVNILCIGKFEPRKHHMMLMDVLMEISQESQERFHLTVIGEATNRHQKLFFTEVKAHVEDGLEELVEIKTNVPRSQVDDYYKEADIFVIPSTREMASVSQLEAMSFSLPVICSKENGTSCYVKHGSTGYLFEDCDKADLKEKLKMLALDRKQILKLGANAYDSVLNNYTFRNYYEGIHNILDQMEQDA